MSTQSAIDLEIERRVNYWLTGPFDDATKAQVQQLKQKDPQGLIDAFFSDLAFGTGGLRALMGPGSNRINIYTIRQATQGLANYLRKQNPHGTLSVLIGFDSRHHSQEFAQESARVLAGNKIHVYLLDELRPTPYISFALRLKGASAGIMITASHNPKEYNGYKVYWSDGAQVVAPHDTGIVHEVDALKDLSCVKLAAIDDPHIETISTAALDGHYFGAIAPLQHFPKESHQLGSSLKIVYTSLHGTGITMVPKALRAWGFSNLHLVKEQITPDGNFPTVKFPNPEYREALQLATQHLEATQSDIAIATDPDADRIGVVARHLGQNVLINGNEMAAICVEYLCQTLTQLKAVPPKGAFVTTIVTTPLLKEIAQKQGIACFEVLTGFKYIGEKIHLWETSDPSYQFIFGAEESYGYLLGTHARDKDAIISACLIAEIALRAKLQGKTLIDTLHAIYKKYGIFREKQLSLNFNPGKEGMEQMASYMHHLRANPLQSISGIPILFIEDYQSRTRQICATHTLEKLDLPQSDVLLLHLADQSRLVIRPSGTEPKIKIYGSVTTQQYQTIDAGIKKCDAHLDTLFAGIRSVVA